MPVGVRTQCLVSRFVIEGASFRGQLSPGLLGWQLHFLACGQARHSQQVLEHGGPGRLWSCVTVGTAAASAGRAAGLPPAPELQASLQVPSCG